jgi:hypothetical protein
MRRSSVVALVFVSVAVFVSATAGPAAASPPTREVIPAPADIVITDQCAFPVLAHIEGSEIDTTFTNKAGETVKLIGVFPGNQLTLTNLDTDTSITLPATGQFHAQLKRDGSGFMLVAGHGPSVPHPITGEPGIWYLSGRLHATFDADGNQTSARSTGQLINLCTQLAG